MNISASNFGRAPLMAGTILLALIAVLLCLIPKPENDLFFELRIGSDILHSHALPRFDTYSWTEWGTRWDVPEWLAFVLYALAFRAGGFFGTWLLLAALTVATAWTVWFFLTRRLGAAPAFGLTTLMLLALSGCLQERPYAFTYLLLAVSVILLTQARDSRLRRLLWLPPLCVVWTNLHQGVTALIGLLLVSALGDAATAGWIRLKSARTTSDLLSASAEEWDARDREAADLWRSYARRAWLVLGTALACFGAGMVSPYGRRVYWNVFITLRNHNLMANVTEWNPATTLPLVQLEPFLAVAIITFGALALSHRRSLADCLVVVALFIEAILHARGIPLFAVGSMAIVGTHGASAAGQIQRHFGISLTLTAHRRLLSAFALVLVGAIALVSFASLRRAVGPRGDSPAGIGEAVAREPSYPADACAFMDREGFPAHLRLLNDFETGGYLMWRLPREPVFVDGRLDVYVGRTFDDMLTLSRNPGSPTWAALVQRYDFDCVLTTSRRQADAFAADPRWQLVYADPDGAAQQGHVFLRRRPEFAALIARCGRDRSPRSQ